MSQAALAAAAKCERAPELAQIGGATANAKAGLLRRVPKKPTRLHVRGAMKRFVPHVRPSRLALLACLIAALAASTASADAPVSLGSAGALERAGLSQDARKNPTGASFGAPTSDDRRLFKLRWRLPWLLADGSGVGASPFSSGFVNTGLGVGGLSLAAEPMADLSALIPQLEIGEEKKLGHLQLGALSYNLGHRSLVDAFTNSPEGASRRAGVVGEVNLAGLGASLALGDLLAPLDFIGGRVHGRPLLWFLAPDATFQPNELDLDPRTETLGIWVVGLSAAVDAAAPAGAGGTGVVAAYGIDNEAAVVDNQFVKVIPYLDLNALSLHRDGVDATTGFGAHLGAQLMLDIAGVRVDIDGEALAGTDGYQPRVFDRLYVLERNETLGSGKPKLLLERPAAWGYRTRAQAGLLESVTVFGELRDQAAFDPARGQHNLTATVGASAFLVMAGGAVTATQTGLGDNALFGPGFVVTGEGRVALILNVLHIVGRAWRAHIPAGDDVGEFVVDEGVSAGLEVNFDVL